jgi:hypothetical protein
VAEAWRMPRSPARSGGQGKLCRGIVELRAGAVTGLRLSQRARVRQSVRAVDKIALNSLAIKPDPSSHKNDAATISRIGYRQPLKGCQICTVAQLEGAALRPPKDFESI